MATSTYNIEEKYYSATYGTNTELRSNELHEATINSESLYRKFLKKNNNLASTQFGFVAPKITDDAVSQLTDFIFTQVGGNEKCKGVFLDLAKAFDIVPIPALVNKLDDISVRETALKIF